MLKKKSNENELEISDILEMAQIIYFDGKSDFFEAIQISDNGVYTGRIINNNFVNGGFIPRQNIKEIIGGIKRKILKKKSKY